MSRNYIWTEHPAVSSSSPDLVRTELAVRALAVFCLERDQLYIALQATTNLRKRDRLGIYKHTLIIKLEKTVVVNWGKEDTTS